MGAEGENRWMKGGRAAAPLDAGVFLQEAMAPLLWLLPSPPCLQWLEGDLLSPGGSSPPSQIHTLATQRFWFKAVGLTLVKVWCFSLEDAVAPLTS